MVLLNLQKAFDSADNTILCDKLNVFVFYPLNDLNLTCHVDKSLSTTFHQILVC